MKDIETLLNKYFEGETTCEEERRLRPVSYTHLTLPTNSLV